MKKLAIITTHPIQYYAPVFKLMQERQQLNIKVFYTWGESCLQRYDHGFLKCINWDIPLLEDYPYEWVTNHAKDPGSHHFNGIINPGLIPQIEQWQPEALLVYGWAYYSHLQCLRYFKGKIPLYFRGDSTLLNNPKGLKKYLRKFYLQWVYQHIDHAFYAGKNNRAYFKYYGLSDTQLSFAAHAIDNERFSEPQQTAASTLRSSINIGDHEILILYAGKFDRVKDVSLLLQAFIDLNRPDVHLLLTGNGAEEVSLKLAVRLSTMPAKIHFMNFQNQSLLPVVYQAADLVCLPSYHETWGLAINEAMACAKAVLVSDYVGCGADLIRENQNGSIFTARSLTSLTGHLKKLIDRGRPGLADMGMCSKAIINSWSFQKQVEAIETTINNG